MANNETETLDPHQENHHQQKQWQLLKADPLNYYFSVCSIVSVL